MVATSEAEVTSATAGCMKACFDHVQQPFLCLFASRGARHVKAEISFMLGCNVKVFFSVVSGGKRGI